VRSDGVFRAADYQFVAALESASCAGSLERVNAAHIKCA
jgi:hypothetical protein